MNEHTTNLDYYDKDDTLGIKGFYNSEEYKKRINLIDETLNEKISVIENGQKTQVEAKSKSEQTENNFSNFKNKENKKLSAGATNSWQNKIVKQPVSDKGKGRG